MTLECIYMSWCPKISRLHILMMYSFRLHFDSMCHNRLNFQLLTKGYAFTAVFLVQLWDKELHVYKMRFRSS